MTLELQNGGRIREWVLHSRMRFAFQNASGAETFWETFALLSGRSKHPCWGPGPLFEGNCGSGQSRGELRDANSLAFGQVVGALKKSN